MNVITERVEHRMFHIMLDKFGTFTMTIRGFSFDIFNIVYTMVSIDRCKHKAGYRLYHKTNAIAYLESWGLCPFTLIISIRIYQRIWIKLQEDIYGFDSRSNNHHYDTLASIYLSTSCDVTQVTAMAAFMYTCVLCTTEYGSWYF